MRLTRLLRAGMACVVLIGAAAVDRPTLAQSGEGAGDATGVARVINTGTMNSLFPQTIMPLPMPQGGGGVAGFADRVKSRDTNFPDRSGRTLINVGTPYVNAIFGGIPEGAGLVGGIELTTADKLGKEVELYGDALVSTRLYRQFEVGMNVGKERDRGEARFIYTRRTRDNFFGLGPFSDEESVEDPISGLILGGETNFDRETRSFQAGYSHYFVPDKVSAGVYFDFTSTSLYEGQDDADPSIFSLYVPYTAVETVSPSPTLYSSQLPGLGTGSRIMTYGVFFEGDGRHNEHGLTQGVYAYLRYAGHNGSDEDPASVVDFGWDQFTADIRAYVPIVSHKTSVALRMFTDHNGPRDQEQIPFYNLTRLGGGTSLRGFDTFRFYGENSLLFQAELRQTLMNFSDDIDKGVDINFFGDAGQAWGLGYGPRVPVLFDFRQFDSFSADNYEVDFGVGVTGRLSKAFAVRLDYGHSNETNKVRLSFTRGF